MKLFSEMVANETQLRFQFQPQKRITRLDKTGGRCKHLSIFATIKVNSNWKRAELMPGFDGSFFPKASLCTQDYKWSHHIHMT